MGIKENEGKKQQECALFVNNGDVKKLICLYHIFNK